MVAPCHVGPRFLCQGLSSHPLNWSVGSSTTGPPPLPLSPNRDFWSSRQGSMVQKAHLRGREVLRDQLWARVLTWVLPEPPFSAGSHDSGLPQSVGMAHSTLSSTLKVWITVLGNESLKIMPPTLLWTRFQVAHQMWEALGEARKQKVENHPFLSFDGDAYDSKMLETLVVIWAKKNSKFQPVVTIGYQIGSSGFETWQPLRRTGSCPPLGPCTR